MYILTIVTVNYNSGRGLQKTCDSVVPQISRDRELYQWILVDGLSSDYSAEWTESPRKSIFDIVISEKDLGVYHAMNKGLNLAAGDYVVFMNSGDEFFPGFSLWSWMKYLQYSEVEGVFYTNVFVKYTNRRNQLIDYSSRQIEFSSGLPFCHQSVYLPRGIYSKEYFNQDYAIYATLPYFLAISKYADFLHVNITSCIYDMSGLSSKIRLRNIKELYRFNNENDNLNINIFTNLVFMYIKSRVKNLLNYY